MDTSKTINSWQINMELSLSKDRLLDFNEERIEDCIKIINDDEIGIFNKIINTKCCITYSVNYLFCHC